MWGPHAFGGPGRSPTLPPSRDGLDPGLGSVSRAWRYPFGKSEAAHGRKPTGRFSDGLVQSDFLAKIMGHNESPPPYTGDSDNWDDGIDASGMNFAVAEAGALEAPPGVLKLRGQVQQLRDLVTGQGRPAR